MWRIVQKMFSLEQQEEAGRLLVTECGNSLPFCATLDEVSLERVRFAVLKSSNGDMTALLQAIDVAQTDWRDALVAAGFGSDVNEHDHWANNYLTQSEHACRSDLLE